MFDKLHTSSMLQADHNITLLDRDLKIKRDAPGSVRVQMLVRIAAAGTPLLLQDELTCPAEKLGSTIQQLEKQMQDAMRHLGVEAAFATKENSTAPAHHA